MKKIISILLCVILIMQMSIVVLAKDEVKNPTIEVLEVAQKRAESFLENINHPAKVENATLLKNLKNEYEAVVFDIHEDGYIIVNLNDLSIPELSFEGRNPYTNILNPIYNGPLNYYFEVGGRVFSIDDGTILDEAKVEYIYSKNKIENTQPMASLEVSNTRSTSTEKYLSYSLQTWTISGGHCGSIASAICMRYYRDYVNSAYVSSSSISKDALIALMKQFVGSGATTYNDMIGGLNNYFATKSLNTTARGTRGFQFLTVKNKININRPVIVGTVDHATFGDHWIIVHGYFESRVDGNYIIVNNGWGRNNVWVTAESQTLDGVIYFSE